MPEYDYTPLANGEIKVEALCTPDEIAMLDKAGDVERLDDLMTKIEDEIALGLAAIKTNLHEKFGAEPVLRIWCTGEQS